MNPAIDLFLKDGCGRCDYYKTEKCKALIWNEPLVKLRMILLDSELKEELKWSQPCYTLNGKNVLIMSAFKDFAFLSFLKGVLLNDPNNLLETPGKNSQIDRRLTFNTAAEVEASEAIIRAFIAEAIALEKSGAKVEVKKELEPIPDELAEIFKEDPAFKTAFESLTPGRQRGYILHFSQPKQSKTRISRIEKCMDKIFAGKGFHDR